LSRIVFSRRAVSPVLTTLLIIVVTVAAVIVTYAWVMVSIRTQTQQAGVALVRENVRYYGMPAGANNRTDIVLTNQGTEDTKISVVYWGKAGYTSLTRLTAGIDYDLAPINGIIAAKSTVTITIKWGVNGLTGGNWTWDTTYYYKVATEAGQYLEFSQRSPSP